MPNSPKSVKNKKGKGKKKQMTLKKQYNLLSEFLGNDFSDSSSSSESKSRSSSKGKKKAKAVEMKCPKCQEFVYDGPYKEYTSFEIIHVLIKSLKDMDIPEVDKGKFGDMISAKTAKRAILFSSIPGLKKYIVMISAACNVLDEIRAGHKSTIMESINVIVNGLEKFLKNTLIKQIDLEAHFIDFSGENARKIREMKLNASKELQIKINEFNHLLNEKIIRYFNEACS